MHHAFFLLALLVPSVAPHPGLNQARADPSCTDIQTVTATTTETSISIPPAITITLTTSVPIFITTTVTASTTQISSSSTSSSTTSSPSLPSGTCTPPLITLPDGGFEERLPWTGQPLTSVHGAWVYDNQRSGQRALQLSVGGRNAGGQYELWQSIIACPGVTYKLFAWAKTPDVSSGCVIKWVMDDSYIYVQNFTTTNYELATATWVAPVPLDEMLILKVTMQCNATAPGLKMVYLDDVSLERVR